MQQQQAKDIISLPIELNDTISDTKFRLVHIAAQRVRQLSSGTPLLVTTRSIKDTTVALEECLVGKFKVVVGEEAQKAKEAFRKREEQAKIDEQLSAKEEEIRKELSAYLSESQEEEGVEEVSPADTGEEGASEEDEATEPDEADAPGE
jgi:DNA-directed RNA polymerase omega subunit